jgi:uncharacterized protein (TIGR02145 family)
MKKLLTIFFLLTYLVSQGQTVTDIDGNIYNTVSIGTQTWTVQNLKTTRYSNGDSILYESVDSVWGGLTIPAFCTYNNDTALRNEYGNLYNFYTVVDSRNLCPTGWHVPSDSEWNILIAYLGGDAIAGGKMKETGFTHWMTPNTGADNSSGLSVIPAGYRYSNNGFNHGGFHGLNGNGGIWTLTSTSDSTSIAKYFYPGSASVGQIDNKKSYGWSVRCVYDMQTGIRENEKWNGINVFPNPTGDLLTIPIDGRKIILIANLQGQIIKTIKTDTKTISLSDLATGNYIISVFNADNKLLTTKQIVYEK